MNRPWNKPFTTFHNTETKESHPHYIPLGMRMIALRLYTPPSGDREALSLFNFVPSCQVCNSRIRGDRLPTVDSEELKVLSPTSDSNDFSHNMAIRLRTRPSVRKSSLGQYIYFLTNPPYEKHVRFFHLEERYEFHKAEAMRLKRLKDRYPDSCIKKIASLLHRREATVKEDIFQMKYLKREGRCFQKLTEDILNNTKL